MTLTLRMRVLQAIVNAQMLSELEEVIHYKLIQERRDAIKQMWWDRLQVRRCRTFVVQFHYIARRPHAPSIPAMLL